MRPTQKPQMSTCQNPTCAQPIAQSPTGRPARYCSNACRQRAKRLRHETPGGYYPSQRVKSPVSVRKKLNKTNGPETASRHETHDLGKPSLWWIEQNEVTWKLTDGSSSRTPYVHGHWPGFNTEKAVGWVIDVGWVVSRHRYYARCGELRAGPFKRLKDAQAAAEALVADSHNCTKGALRLNAITALLLDGGAR